MVLDHEHEHTSRWATLVSIADKIGCTAQTLHQWVGRAERDSGRKPGLITDMAAKLTPGASWARGHHVSIKYTECLAEAGIEPSVGSVSDSCDNALAETINGLYKAEVIHRRGPWRSFEAVEFATLAWVDWFNNRRLLEPIGNIPPAEAEKSQPAIAA